MPDKKRRFAIALSFPGEHRRFVKNVAERLAGVLGKKRVFFDEWHTAEIRGSGADLKLKRIYRDESELVVPFFSKHYAKMWCQIEWHAIRALLAERRKDDAVIPVRLDRSVIEGWEVIDLGIYRKAGQSASYIADQLLDVYRLRRKRAGLAPIPPPPTEIASAPPVAEGKPAKARRRVSLPTVVLMDSTLPDVVYDNDTRSKGGTNADDITAALSDLSIETIKETTSLMWRRDEQVLRVNPDLIVIHFSAFYSTTNADDSDHRLEEFLKYLAATSVPFLIYSRMSTAQREWLEQWIGGVQTRTPALAGRLNVLPIEHGPSATFRDPALARRLKQRVKELLKL